MTSRGCQASLSNTVMYLLQLTVAAVSRMTGQENLDRDLRDFQPPKKKANTTRESGARFKCLTCDEEMAGLSKGFVPANTQKNKDWAMRVFSEWRVQ